MQVMQRNHHTISPVDSVCSFSWASKGASNTFVQCAIRLTNIAGREHF